MTKNDFLKDYYCKVNISENLTNLKIVTEVIRRSDGAVVDDVATIINIRETNNWINDSQTAISLNEWDWNKLIEEAKRAQLDYFVQRIPIDNYYPLDKVSNPSIADMYR